jgi:hypothetical protein
MKRALAFIFAIFILQACTCNFYDLITYFETGMYPDHCDELYFYPSTVAANGDVIFSWHSYSAMHDFQVIVSKMLPQGGYALYRNDDYTGDSVQVAINWDELGTDTIRADVSTRVETIAGSNYCDTFTTFRRVLPPDSTNSALDCSQLVLTSPQGLPQGEVTFYWNAVDNAANYQLNIYSAGTKLAGWEVAAPTTNLLANVSDGAIHGQNPFTIELIAESADGWQCARSYTMDREAAPPVSAPPAQEAPDCEEDPQQSGC